MTLQEAKDALVEIYVKKEENDAETKAEVLDIVAELPMDMDAKKIKALTLLAAKEAKGKFQELSEATSMMTELIEELSDD